MLCEIDRDFGAFSVVENGNDFGSPAARSVGFEVGFHRLGTNVYEESWTA